MTAADYQREKDGYPDVDVSDMDDLTLTCLFMDTRYDEGGYDNVVLEMERRGLLEE